MTTKVMNLSTGGIQVYTLPPMEAVNAAYEQSINNWNTWKYTTEHVKVTRSGKHCYRGDFSARLEETR